MAETRETQVIEDVINGDEISNPRTTEEAILAQVVAGETVTINPRNRMQYWLSQLESGGGENPNSTETVTGTLANPWGTMESQEISAFFADLANGDASAIMTIDASLLDAGSISSALMSVESFCAATGLAIDDTQTGSGFRAIWSSTYLAAAYVVSITGTTCSIVNLREYASLLPTSTQIFHHPMPT